MVVVGATVVVVAGTVVVVGVGPGVGGLGGQAAATDDKDKAVKARYRFFMTTF